MTVNVLVELSNRNIILDNCENKYYTLKGNKKECHNNCPSNYYLIEDSKECVIFCTFPYLYLYGNICVKSCKKYNKYLNPYTKSCLNNCPLNYFEKYNGNTFECMAE